MFTKITKGHGAVKLAVYLAGPGRHNEHTEQHVIAASEAMATVEAGQGLDHDSAVAFGMELDRPNKIFGKGSTRQHIWHVSLALDPGEGRKDDAWWESVAREFMTKMGFEGLDGDEFRWVAVRHGVSTGGNDHIHIAASMISESGVRWKTNRDWPRASQACRDIEEAHGLRVLGQGVSTQGYARGELESLARRRAYALHMKQCEQDPTMTPWKFLDRVSREQLIAAQVPAVQPRVEMALAVRAATAGARSEAEFIRRARGNGLILRPRYAKGSRTEVEGYSVALRPLHGEEPIWYGGNRLGKDLSLPSMRAGWPDDDKDAALAEWDAARRGRPAVAPEQGEVSGVELAAYFKDMSSYLRRVAGVSVDDPVAYAQIAREGAGLLSSWAVAAGREGDSAAKDLRAAAQIFARHAELSEQPARAVTQPSEVFADLCTHVAISKSRRAGAVALVRAWANMGEELGKGFKAHGWAVRAESLRTELRGHLDTVHDQYRIMNPLQPKAPAEGAVAVAEKPVRISAAAAREARLQQLEERMRAEGVPEKAIAARMFGERQKSGAPLQGRGPFPGPAKHTEQDPARQKSRGHDQGKGLS